MTVSDVRQLRGEDLERLDWADPVKRARSLAEAGRLAAGVDEFDYLVACAGDRVVGIGAAGYRTPFGAASLVSWSVAPGAWEAGSPVLLLTRLEQRARELTCLSVQVRVDAEDVRSRAAFETLGYGLVGATTSSVPCTSGGPPVAPRGVPTAAVGPGAAHERHVDGWVLRKEL